MAKKALNIRLEKFLIRQKNLFEKQIRKTNQHSTNRNVHDLRVSLRRIRAALWLIEHGTPHLSFGKLPTALHRLAQVLGEKRELDVAIHDATLYHLKLNELKSRRRLAAKILSEKIEPKHSKKIIARIENAIRKQKKHPEVNLAVGLLQLRGRLFPWIRKARISDEDLHQLRITAKKARYVLEALGRPALPLRNLQDPLGRGHDLEVLQELVGKNKKVQTDAFRQYQIARRSIQPTLRFAVKQLEAST